MEKLIKVHQQAKQKQADAINELNNLQVRENELKEKMRMFATHVNSAEQQVSKALTKESLEKAQDSVEKARKNENDI